MNLLKQAVLRIGAILLFWIVFFDFQRILFSIHNWSKFSEVGWGEWFGAFVYSFRLDLATAGLLSILPFLFLAITLFKNKRIFKRLFYGVMFLEILVCSFIHAGEINAYPEWNHKLTSRVFMHLSNPDEVFRTADYGMTFWFVIYSLLEIVFGFKWMRYLFSFKWEVSHLKTYLTVSIYPFVIALFTGVAFIFGRGGLQQIPINIDAAYYSNHYVANDLSVNSTYFFAKSFLLYKRAEIDAFIPKVEESKAKQLLNDFYSYPIEHDVRILKNKRPNVVFIILESWTATAIGSIYGQESATPNFDKLTKEGLLFTNIYATGSTSEIGNAGIFSGYPAVPEISISMQPDKHRKLPCLNEDLEGWGYSTSYLFSGDLKYGNIGGYFVDHGFDEVEDEQSFPKDLPRGKLNFYDEDLYKILIEKMNRRKEPFMQCAFTGSTHSPYDYPKDKKHQKFEGAESEFMNSMVYADECLYNFLEDCKKENWYKNTLFVIVADHGHASKYNQNPSVTDFFHIPLLLYGEPLKNEFKGVKIDQVGSQADIARTLLVQMGGDFERYEWSKDLLNPTAPQFALHTLIRGYGWVTEKGHFNYQMDSEQYIENTFEVKNRSKEKERCNAFLSLIYQHYKSL